MVEKPLEQQRKIKDQDNRRAVLYTLAAIAGLLGIIADFLIGYVERGSSGLFGMAQIGWGTLPMWRPMVSMLLLSLIFPVYILAIFTLSHDIEKKSPVIGQIIRITILISCPGWLLVHGLFSFPQYIYAFLYQKGHSDLALEISDALLTVAAPSLAVTFIFMGVALVALMLAIVRRQTHLPPGYALFNPLIIACLTLPLMQVLPRSSLILGLSMGTMHWGLMLFFAFSARFEFKQKHLTTVKA